MLTLHATNVLSIQLASGLPFAAAEAALESPRTAGVGWAGVIPLASVAALGAPPASAMAFGSLTSLLCEGDSFSVLAGHLFATIFAFAPAMAAAVTLLLGVVHAALGRWCRRYAGAALEQRLVTCLHSLFGLVYAIQIVPYTYFVSLLLFDQDFISRCVQLGQQRGREGRPPAAPASCFQLPQRAVA